MSEKEIRNNLWKYLLGKSSIDELKDWFIPESWDVEKGNDGELVELVNRIKLRLAEFSSGAWNEPELKGQLIQILVGPVSVNSVQFHNGFSSITQGSTTPVQPVPNDSLRGNDKVDNPILELEYTNA
jgi:hypothetical protein